MPDPASSVPAPSSLTSFATSSVAPPKSTLQTSTAKVECKLRVWNERRGEELVWVQGLGRYRCVFPCLKRGINRHVALSRLSDLVAQSRFAALPTRCPRTCTALGIVSAINIELRDLRRWKTDEVDGEGGEGKSFRLCR